MAKWTASGYDEDALKGAFGSLDGDNTWTGANDFAEAPTVAGQPLGVGGGDAGPDQVTDLGVVAATATLANPATYALQTATLGGNTVITAPAPVVGESFMLWLTQDATGGREPSFDPAVTVAFPAGDPVWRTDPDAVTILSFVSRDAASWECYPVADAAAVSSTPAAAPATFLGGSSIAVMGDSNSQRGNVATNSGPVLGRYGMSSSVSYLLWTCLLSGGRLRMAGAFATGGETSTYIKNIHLPQVVAAKPDYCVVLAGTNDNGGVFGAPTTADGSIANLKAIYDGLDAAGITPILATLPPKTDTGWQQKVNHYIRLTADHRGYPMVDLQALLANANGTWKAGYNDASDGLHLTPAAAKAFGQAIVDAVSDRLARSNRLLKTQLTTDPTRLFNNPLFLTDTNADQTPDLVFVGGAPTVALGPDTSTPAAPRTPARGNLLTITRTAVNAQLSMPTGAAMTVVPGNRYLVGYAVSGEIEAANTAAGNTTGIIQVKCVASDFSADLLSFNSNLDVPPGSALVAEVTIPAGVTGLRVTADVNTSTNAKLSLGQVTIVDLTAQGLLA